jgi:hypothetical protein
MLPGVVAVGLVLPCSAPQLTQKTAQDLLDHALGEGVVEVESVQSTAGGEIFGRIVLFSEYGDADLQAGFQRRATRWTPATIHAAGRSFSFSLLVEQQEQAPQLLTLVYMTRIATAIGTFRVDTGAYPETMHALVAPERYARTGLPLDGWGNPFRYVRNSNDLYTLTSLGSDGRRGPAPPSPWVVPLYDPDIVMSNGEFTQAPGEGRRDAREARHGQAR